MSSGRPRMSAWGFRCACLRAAIATLPKCSRLVPYSCMWRCAHMPITSTGRMSPHGVWSALSSLTRTLSCAQGRAVFAPRFRARWQTTVDASPLAIEAPPPYEILLHQRSPSTPSRRAIETSCVASISSMHMPSTSSTRRPASSSASWIASTAVSEMGRPMSLANGRWPMPTIATRSWRRRKRSRSRGSVMRDSAEAQRELERPVYGRQLLGHQLSERRRQRLLVDGGDGVEVGDTPSRQAVLLAEGHLGRNPPDARGDRGDGHELAERIRLVARQQHYRPASARPGQLGPPDVPTSHHHSTPARSRTAAAWAASISRRLSGMRRYPASYSRTKTSSACCRSQWRSASCMIALRLLPCFFRAFSTARYRSSGMLTATFVATLGMISSRLGSVWLEYNPRHTGRQTCARRGVRARDPPEVDARQAALGAATGARAEAP